MRVLNLGVLEYSSGQGLSYLDCVMLRYVMQSCTGSSGNSCLSAIEALPSNLMYVCFRYQK